MSWCIISLHPLRPPVVAAGSDDQRVLAKFTIECGPVRVFGVGLWRNLTTGRFSLRFPNDGRFRRVVAKDRASSEAMTAAALAALAALDEPRQQAARNHHFIAPGSALHTETNSEITRRASPPGPAPHRT